MSMADLWPLLTGDPLDDDAVINRQLRPAGCAVAALSSLKGRGFVNRVVDQWFCWLSASG